MDNSIIVALISFAGTLLGSIIGIMASAKLTNYRIQQLETKVEKHNNFAVKIPLLESDIKECKHRIDTLEGLHREK